MRSKSCCNREWRRRVTKKELPLLAVKALLGVLLYAPAALAGGDAPQWMHALVNVPLPTHDAKTDAVLLYSETNVTVLSTDKIKVQKREAYKILRPEGRGYGLVGVYFNPERKIKSLHGWCIPPQGKDYEVKDKDAVDVSAPEIRGSELISDTKHRVLRIPAPDPGNIIGYEYEVEERPFFLQDTWYFQEEAPVRESQYSLQLPASWEFKASWLNSSEIKPTEVGNNLWKWTMSDIKGIRPEPDMPPFVGVSQQMIVTFFPPGGQAPNGFAVWGDMGRWYATLIKDRLDASPQIKEEVATLAAGKSTLLQKMQALANFVQNDVRYVAIELGIGGWQPHAAPDVFSHRYGDCKDKATLMRTMLRELGVDSYQVVINTRRGAVTAETPAHNGFNHVITAIKLPDGLADPSMIATIQHPRLGRILFFDPTNEFIPFGQIPGYLQANYGLLVTADGGELVELPMQPSSMNSITRTGRLTLDPAGRLTGDVKEVRLGERASSERWRLRAVAKETDRIKPIEAVLGGSLANFRITRAIILNLNHTDQPFGFDYSFESENYAKNAGDLVLLRPRVLGAKALNILETKEPRKFPVEFEGPVLDTDSFEITIPPGYVVDDLPPAVDADYGFASYHSKTEVKGNVISYTRTFELKELSVPVIRAEELKKFYRVIANDERSTAVLKASAK